PADDGGRAAGAAVGAAGGGRPAVSRVGESVPMLRWLTAGESHGPALTAVLEGLPAGVRVDRAAVEGALARRRLGYGRGARMKFEADRLSFLGGMRHGLTLGSPLALQIANTEWARWEAVMSPEPVQDEAIRRADDVGAPQ